MCSYLHIFTDDGSIIRKSLFGGQEVFVEEQAEQEEADQLVDTNIEGDCSNSNNRPMNLLARKIRNEEILIEEVRK